MLDQSQTITVNLVARNYVQTFSEKRRVERGITLPSGMDSTLAIDHTVVKNGSFANYSQHLIQLVECIDGSAQNEPDGSIVINITVKHPKWADKAHIAFLVDGLSDWVSANIARIVGMES